MKRRNVPTRKERIALQIKWDVLAKRFLPNGYTGVPNFVLDKLFVMELPTDFVRFYLTLWRQTIGYQSDATTISMRALQEFARSRNRTAVSAYIRAMEACGLISYKPSPSPTNGNGGGQKRSEIRLLDSIGDMLKVIGFFCALRDVFANGGVPSRGDFMPEQFAKSIQKKFDGFLMVCRCYDGEPNDEKATKVGLDHKLSLKSIGDAIAFAKVYGA